RPLRTSASACLRSATSPGRLRTSVHRLSSFSADARASALRAVMMRGIPRRAKRRATSSPRPREAPVMSATLAEFVVCPTVFVSFPAIRPAAERHEALHRGLALALFDEAPGHQLDGVPLGHGDLPARFALRVCRRASSANDGQGDGLEAVSGGRTLPVP